MLSAVIPAYNESAHLEAVLAVLRDVPELTEIMVVDDGSGDATWAAAQRAAAGDARVRLHRHPVNRGKAEALFTGARAAAGEYLLLLDADLHGLTPAHVRALTAPVLAGQTEMSLGIFRGGKIPTDFAHWATPWLSGQRCLPRKLFLQIPLELSSGFGIEPALTVLSRRWRWRVHPVIMRGVWHPPSEIHRGVWPGLRHRAKMYAQIVKTWWKLRRWKG